MVEIIDRRKHALGTQAWNRSESAITTIVWHYTAGARRRRAFITGHENYWKNTLGWRRGGYHYYIDADGKIYQNYNLTTRTNGARNQNSHTVHISVEANSASDYSQAQINARQELTLYLMKRLNIKSNRVRGHKELPGQSTSCPGYSTAQMNAFRKQLAKGAPGKVTVATGGKEKAPSVAPTGQRLHLPTSASSWNVYNPSGPYTSGNQVAKLAPSKFGGLSYDIVGNPTKDVYLIQSGQFGTVAIYAAKSTGATISGSGAGSAKPKPSKMNNKVLQLPASADTWKVYNQNGPYTARNSIHELTPSRFGGLEYVIQGNPTPNVYLIDTGVKGRVAIYAGPETGAKIVDKREKEGWVKNNTGWWYREADGSYPKSGWRKVSGVWYLFDSRGYMLTGWHKVKGTWYFMANNGHMQTGWTKVGSEWYYMNSSGAMQTGLLSLKGKTYFLQRNGALITDDIVELEANRHGHLGTK